ncbi:CopG family transcriptional regulator [Candidatus Falkowbacteria bacterium]|nr:CopG family transcriptional regulator [Candidatus Falkowbacteria bacterium]
MTTEKDKAAIKIPRSLCNTLKSVIAERGYSSVTDFVVFVLRDIMTPGLNENDIEAIRLKFQELGYL